VVVADIGLRVAPLGQDPRAAVIEASDVSAWVPARAADAHKWTAGVLVVAGSPGMRGAAHLVAGAAQRAGAGMVRVGSPGADDDPERPVEAVGMALPDHGWAELVLAAADRFRALVIGPGLGTDAATTREIREVVTGVPLPTVVDGDALTALGHDVGAVLAGRPGPTVLTPHDGELERLTGAPAPADRMAVGRALAAETGATVLLKGPCTVVADPDGRVRIVTSGDARLATAGTGDVLSGVIGALLARGLAGLEAAAAGAWLHARAGALGPPEGLVASDLVDRLPAARAEVEG
jgi:NAD(P)H-hydrate epimerase